MKMQKRQFRIGELAKHLGIERFVIRFWEKEFNLRPSRSDGGQRFYEEKDLQKLQTIKKLLYHRGYTILGAKRALQKETPRTIVVSKRTTLDEEPQTIDQLHEKLKHLRQHLVRLQELL